MFGGNNKQSKYFIRSNNNLQFHRILILLAAAVCINGQFLSYDPHSTECALVLEGPGRSSSYDYNLNLFRDTL